MHHIQRHAGKRRRLVGNRVVIAGTNLKNRFRGCHVIPTGTKSSHIAAAEDRYRACARIQRAETTGVQRTEGRLDIQAAFALEDVAFGT